MHATMRATAKAIADGGKKEDEENQDELAAPAKPKKAGGWLARIRAE